MSKKSVIMLVILLLIIIAGIGVTVWRFSQNTTQDLTSSAQESNNSGAGSGAGAGAGASCQVPDEVSNVSVDYPSCN